MQSGNSLLEMEITGYSEIDERRYDFEDFLWGHSCEVENNKGEVIGDVVSICNLTFRLWLKMLRDAGAVIFPYLMLLEKDGTTPFVTFDSRRCLCLFSSEDAVRSYVASVWGNSSSDLRCNRFRNAASLASFLAFHEPNLASQGCLHLALDATHQGRAQTGVISEFIKALEQMR